MTEPTVRALARALAEQQYMLHLLAKILREKGHLLSGELDARWNAAEKAEFDNDFWKHLNELAL